MRWQERDNATAQSAENQREGDKMPFAEVPGEAEVPGSFRKFAEVSKKFMLPHRFSKLRSRTRQQVCPNCAQPWARLTAAGSTAAGNLSLSWERADAETPCASEGSGSIGVQLFAPMYAQRTRTEFTETPKKVAAHQSAKFLVTWRFLPI